MLKSITFIYLVATALAVVAAVGLGVIVSKLDPGSSWSLAGFYLDVLALIGSITFVIGFYFRQTFGTREFARMHMLISARQSLWFASVVIVSLILLSNGVFNWLNTAFLILCLVFLESYFLFK